MKFLDKETGTLGERIRTLFKEQGITIISILTALRMTLGVLIEALLGGPSNPLLHRKVPLQMMKRVELENG